MTIISKKVKSITHCEINTELSEIVAHNFRQLGVVNIDCKVGDSLNTLESINQKWDWIYIDPF
jgi:predicted O-methyltransferase YrrM